MKSAMKTKWEENTEALNDNDKDLSEKKYWQIGRETL